MYDATQLAPTAGAGPSTQQDQQPSAELRRFTEALFRPSKRNEGHKIYRNALGEISLADWSGTYPERTDDGPLIVAPGALIEVGLYQAETTFIVPVTVMRTGGSGMVWTNYETACCLVKHAFAHVSLGLDFDHAFAHFLQAAALANDPRVPTASDGPVAPLTTGTHAGPRREFKWLEHRLVHFASGEVHTDTVEPPEVIKDVVRFMAALAHRGQPVKNVTIDGHTVLHQGLHV